MKKHCSRVAIPIRLWRILRIALHVLRAIVYLGLYFDRMDFSTRARYVTQWSSRLLQLAGVKAVIQDTYQTLSNTPRAFLIANHISWLDIFVIYQASFAYFIAKAEIRQWPVLGFLTRKSGTLFIERGKRRDTARINEQIHQTLSEGARVALFPEGTTSHGITVQSFYSSLLQPAIDAKANVIPITLQYLDSSHRPSIHASYTGEMSLLKAIWQLVSETHTTAIMVVGPAIAGDNLDRKTLSLHAHAQISHHLSILNQS